MSRSEARIKVRIWDDPDFLALDQRLQWAYLFLLSQDDLSQAGVMPLRWRRLCTRSGMNEEALEGLLLDLEARRFVVVDLDMEEVAIRTFIRNDGVYKQPNVLRSARRVLGSVASARIRDAIRGEIDVILARCKESTPDGSVSILLGMATDLDERAARDPKPEVTESMNPDSSIKGMSEGLLEGFPEGFGEPIGEPKGDRGIGSSDEVDLRTTTGGSPPKPGSDQDVDFVEFWTMWPRKVKKPKARASWVAAVKKEDSAKIVAAARAFLDQERRRGAGHEFIPHATSWLNQERWGDELDPVSPAVPDTWGIGAATGLHVVPENWGVGPRVIDPEIEFGANADVDEWVT